MYIMYIYIFMCLRNLGKIKIKIPEDSLILIQQKETIYIYIWINLL